MLSMHSPHAIYLGGQFSCSKLHISFLSSPKYICDQVSWSGDANQLPNEVKQLQHTIVVQVPLLKTDFTGKFLYGV